MAHAKSLGKVILRNNLHRFYEKPSFKLVISGNLKLRAERLTGKEEFEEDEPDRLLKKGEFRAAVISAVALFESEVKKMLGIEDEEQVTSRKLIDLLYYKHRYISADDYSFLKRALSIRNQAVHTPKPISPNTAKEIVDGIKKILQKLKDMLG